MLSSSGEFIRKWGVHGADAGQLNRPHAITFDSQGHLYVVSHKNTWIQKFDTGGMLLGRWELEGGGAEPTSAHFDAHDRLWLVDPANHRVLAYDTQGNLLLEIGHQGDGEGEFNRPTGVALDGQGFLYVSDTGNHRIQKFEL